MKLDCSIVKDLIPNYIDGLTSQKSNELIEEHFQECKECSESYQSMKTPIQEIDHTPEIKEFNGFLTKTKRMYLLRGILLSLGFIAIFTSMLVDGIINRTFTWSLIVLASVVFVYVVGLTAAYAKKNKLIKSLLMFTVLLFPLLEVISVESTKLSGASSAEWFIPYGFEFAAIWILDLWIGVGVWYFTHKNIWYGCSAVFFLAIPCDLLTQKVVRELAPSEEPSWVFILEVMIYLIISLLLWYIGRKNSTKKKRKGITLETDSTVK